MEQFPTNPTNEQPPSEQEIARLESSIADESAAIAKTFEEQQTKGERAAALYEAYDTAKNKMIALTGMPAAAILLLQGTEATKSMNSGDMGAALESAAGGMKIFATTAGIMVAFALMNKLNLYRAEKALAQE